VPRRILLSLLVSVALVSVPGIAYEAFEKTAERVGPTGSLLHLSLTAELVTPWRPATGLFVVDRTLHELEETWTFWSLVRDRGRPSSSATAVAAFLVGR